MGKINCRRVFLGGLLAGLILNVLGFAAWALFLGRTWRAALETLGHPLEETFGALVLMVLLYFVVGILAVWLYAAIRPRYGAGPRTAVVAGFAFWLLSGLIPTIGWGSLRLFSADLLALDALTSLVMVVVATLVGAWIYTEQG